jgi:hypothetical protein
VLLGDIIKINDDSEFQIITTGSGEKIYAVNKSGDFSSDPIEIPSFTASAPSLSDSQLEFILPQFTNNAPAREASGAQVELDLLNSVTKTLNYGATNIDGSIHSLTDLGLNNFKIRLDFTESDGLAEIADVELQNLNVILPKGLTMNPGEASYNAATGEYILPSLTLVNGKGAIEINASSINLPANAASLDYDSHSINIDSEVVIERASLAVTPTGSTSIPSSVGLNVSYTISPLEVSSITGSIEYRLEGDGLNISPIDLDGLPSFLEQEGTNLVLANPQIYLNLNNPVADDKLSYQSGLALIPVRDNTDGNACLLDNGVFKVNYNNGVGGPYNFCLSPKAVEADQIPSEFAAGCTHVPYSSLSYVVSGDGLPQQIRIDLRDPMIPLQEVNGFRLGHDLPHLEGKWQFLAPIALKSSESKIIYSDRKTGWNDDDVDAITITTLELSMIADSKLSLNAELSGTPLDKNGKPIPGVTITPVTIKGNTDNQEVKLVVQGTVTHLDGFEFTATVTSDSDAALSPDQTLKLKNIRAKVSGNYTKEL